MKWNLTWEFFLLIFGMHTLNCIDKFVIFHKFHLAFILWQVYTTHIDKIQETVFMKFDMRCRTKADAAGAGLPIEKYIKPLRDTGSDLILSAGQDSCKGHRYWVHSRNKTPDGFVVLKGMGYDLKNTVYFIMVMPSHICPRVFRMRGMDVDTLTRLAHRCGGIGRSARPFGVKGSGAMFFRTIKENPGLIKGFPLPESFKAREIPRSDKVTQLPAKKYNKPCSDGSINCIKERGIAAFA